MKIIQEENTARRAAATIRERPVFLRMIEKKRIVIMTSPLLLVMRIPRKKFLQQRLSLKIVIQIPSIMMHSSNGTVLQKTTIKVWAAMGVP